MFPACSCFRGDKCVIHEENIFRKEINNLRDELEKSQKEVKYLKAVIMDDKETIEMLEQHTQHYINLLKQVNKLSKV